MLRYMTMMMVVVCVKYDDPGVGMAARMHKGTPRAGMGS